MVSSRKKVVSSIAVIGSQPSLRNDCVEAICPVCKKAITFSEVASGDAVEVMHGKDKKWVHKNHFHSCKNPEAVKCGLCIQKGFCSDRYIPSYFEIG